MTGHSYSRGCRTRLMENNFFDDPTTDELIKLANDAAKLAARSYFGIDAEDIASSILETVYKNAKRYERHLEHRGWLWSVFYAEAVKYCNACVRDFQYFSNEYYYTPQEVRDLLEKVYSTDVQDNESVQISEATLSMIDLAVAFHALNFKEKDLISRKLRDGEKMDATGRKAYYRATERLASLLNRNITGRSRERLTHEGPGSRKVLTNARAQSITRFQESGTHLNYEGMRA